MTQKQLTTDQIKELHKLVERNAIKYYDVEVEIVDHYASAIEEIWAEEPSVSFYNAQMRVYKEFWDFQGLQKDKRLALTQQASKELWGHIKNAFTWPNVVELIGVSTLIFFGFYFLFEIIMPRNLALSLTLLGGIFAFVQFAEIRFFNKKLGHSFLRLDTILANFACMASIWLNIAFHILENLNPSSITTMIGLSVVFALFTIVTKETYKVLRRELANLKKQYA